MFPVKHNTVIYHTPKQFNILKACFLNKNILLNNSRSFYISNLSIILNNLDSQQVHKCFRNVPSFIVQSSKNEKVITI